MFLFINQTRAKRELQNSRGAICFLVAPAAKTSKYDISSVLERLFLGGLDLFFLLLDSFKKQGVLIHNSSLASCQLVSSQR